MGGGPGPWRVLRVTPVDSPVGKPTAHNAKLNPGFDALHDTPCLFPLPSSAESATIVARM